MTTILDPIIVRPEEDFTQEEKEALIKSSAQMMTSLSEDTLKVLQDTYGEIKGTKAFEVLAKGKLLGLDFAMNWQDSKATGENIANFTGNFIQGAATAIVLTGFTSSGIIIAAATIGITYGLKEAGFELGDYTESLYEYSEEFIKSTIESQQIKYETWQSLTPEEQAYWISAGGTPWNYNISTLLDELNNKDLNIIDKIKELLKQASTISSPLVLDINKDGTINTTGKIVNFDLDNNGYAELTAWVNSEDGILVYDKNNNGIIDNGSELFGNNTTLSTGKLAL